MAKKKPAARKKSSKVLRGGQPVDVAARAAAAVTAALGKAAKGKSGLGKDGKMNVHVHLGDVVMMGFDEAVDAEEWGMRETNNEVVGKARGGKGRADAGLDADARAEKNRKVKRQIKFRKGALQLDAVEHSAPARKKTAKKKAATRKRR
jgi:hypothetical protein